MPFPGVTIDQADAAKAVGTVSTGAGVFSGLSSVLSPVAAGLGLAGGLSDMFGTSSGTSDVSEAGGQLYGGSFNPMIIGGKNNMLIIVLVILVAIFLLKKD